MTVRRKNQEGTYLSRNERQAKIQVQSQFLFLPGLFRMLCTLYGVHPARIGGINVVWQTHFAFFFYTWLPSLTSTQEPLPSPGFLEMWFFSLVSCKCNYSSLPISFINDREGKGSEIEHVDCTATLLTGDTHLACQTTSSSVDGILVSVYLSCMYALMCTFRYATLTLQRIF